MNIHRVFLFFSVVGMICALSSVVSAGTIIYEPFDYTTGSAIIGQTDTSTPSNPIWRQTITGTAGASVHQAISGSLSGPSGFPASVGNAAEMLNGDFAEIARMTLPQQYGPNSTLYYSLLLNVPDTAGLTVANSNVNANNDIIIGFNNTPGTGARPSVWTGELVIRLGSAANTFNLGIRASTTVAGTTYFTGDLTTATTYLVVARYTSGATAGTGGVNDLWINPSSATFGLTAPAPDGSTAGHISNTASSDHVDTLIIGAGIAAGATPNQTNIDEIRVGETWADVTSVTAFVNVPEPATIGLLGIAILGVMAQRRRIP